MPGRNITRADLAEAVYRSVGMSRQEAGQLVESVLEELSDALARGETVKLASFGSLVVSAKGQRMGRNPKTGMDAVIAARRVMTFKPSYVLKDRVNGIAVTDESGLSG